MNFNIEYNKKIFQLHNLSPELDVIRAAVEQEFSLKSGAYTLSYLDIENDPIAVEDEDDLAVCILEFSEMSKIDDCINLVIKDKNSGIPRRRDTPKGSRENSPKMLKSQVSNQSFIKIASEPVILTESREVNLETMSQATLDDAVSRVSEKVMSITESKISEMVESRLEEMMQKKMEETMEKKIAEMQAIKEKEKIAKEAKKLEKENKKKAEKKAKKDALEQLKKSAKEAKKAKEEAKKAKDKLLKSAKKKVEEIKSLSLKEQQEKELKLLESKIEEKKELVVSPPLTGSEKKGDVVTVEVGPVWSHNDFLARKDKGEFNNLLESNWKMTGHWWTTKPGSMSVVQFAFHEEEEKKIEEPVVEEKKTLVVSPAITGSEKKGDCVTVEVGPILSHKDFLDRNVKGEFKDLLGPKWKMTGHWWMTVAGKMSVVQFTYNGEEEKPQEILKAIHHGIICDACDETIVGTRFKCMQRYDYDLCEKCEPYHNREHLMIRITEPQVLPNAMRGGNLVELDMQIPPHAMGLTRMQMRNCPFRRVNKPKSPPKPLEFKVVNINDCLNSHRGYVNATWEDVESNMQAVKDAVKHIHWGIVKVEDGSFDGPGYQNRHRKEDTRPLGHKLLVKKENRSGSSKRIARKLPHIIKKVAEGLKTVIEKSQEEINKKKNDVAETQET